MHLEDPTQNAVEYIVHNMREWDRKEIFATRTNNDEADFCRDVLLAGPISWVAGTREPIAVFGCAPKWPGVWSMWFFATDKLPKIGLSVTKMIVNGIVPMLFEGGAHRLECRSMEGHVDAQRWLETLGAKRECTLKGYGRDGEDFHVYVWEKP